MTVRFFLVRHGAAEPAGRGGDAARRLTPAGRAAFAALLGRLGPRLQPARVLSSPLARARETAALLGAARGVAVEELPALASGASSPEALLALGRAAGPGVAVVGHNPELAAAVQLAAGRPVEVPPGTVAAVDAGGRLAWIERP